MSRSRNDLKGRSIKLLERQGYAAGDVERWLPIPGGRKVTKDFLGFADLVAIGPMAVVLVQVTSRSNVASRVRKIRDVLAEKGWEEMILGHPFVRIEVHGWQRQGRSVTVKVVQVERITKPVSQEVDDVVGEVADEAQQHSSDRGDRDSDCGAWF